MKGGFWAHARKTGRPGFFGGKSDVAEKMKKEVPQQLAQNREKLEKKDDEKGGTKDSIPGGKADGEPDSKFPKGELKKGAQHEKEHTNSPSVAKEIAKDHIKEDRSYYKKLEKVEKKK